MAITIRGLEKSDLTVFLGEDPYPANSWYMCFADSSNPRVVATSNLSVEDLDGNVNISNHNFQTGTKVSLTGIPPNGLALSTSYYLIRRSANFIAFAETIDDANNGEEIAITANGDFAFSIVVSPIIDIFDDFSHFVESEIATPGYVRRPVFFTAGDFVAGNIRKVVKPQVTVVVNAVQESISYTHIGIVAGGESALGSITGDLFFIYPQESRRTIPAGIGYTFSFSVNLANTASNVSGK